jgi:hypothetical protein
VTKFDAFQGSIRELRVEVDQAKAGKADPAKLRTLVATARTRSGVLTAHLMVTARHNERSREHYQGLLSDVTVMRKQLEEMQVTMPFEAFDQGLTAIESKLPALTQQTPYTLLMMRIVEIGLPVLLSIFSVIFIFRYSLTEKRSREIKELIEQRNRINA